MRHFTKIILASVLVFGTMTARAENACSSLFLQSWEITSRVQKNRFVTSRDLIEYQHTLHVDFLPSLKKLRSDQHWVDLGAGKANAQIEYLKSFPDSQQAAQTTAVAYKLDRWFSPPRFDGKLLIKEGAFETQSVSAWKKADLVTDVFGVLSYTHDMHASLQKIFDLMNVQGELYIFGNHYTSSFRGENQAVGLIDFLKSIDGLRVEGKYGTIKVTKEKEHIQIPYLELTGVKDDAPPIRSFKILP